MRFAKSEFDSRYRRNSEYSRINVDCMPKEACLRPLDDLVGCLVETDCYKQGKPLKDCLRSDKDAQTLCDKQRNEFFACKHNMASLDFSLTSTIFDYYQ